MFGLDYDAFWMLIGAPTIVITLMFLKCLLIRKETDD